MDSRYCNARTYVADGVVADRNICNRADWAQGLRGRTCLVFRRQQDRISNLAETAPAVFKYIALDQNASGVFELQVILDHEWVPADPAGEAGLAGHPGQWLEEVIATDFDVGRRGGCTPATEQNVFRRRFKEVSGDLVHSVSCGASAAKEHVRVGASSG